MSNHALKLTDAEMRDFIINGYVKVKVDFSPSFHENVYQQLDEMFEGTGNLGNNVLPLIPEIQEVFDHPVVHGAMQSVLGEDYAMHSHRYCHFNQQGSEGQNFHKDSYEGDEQIRRHRMPLDDGVLLSAGCHRRHGIHCCVTRFPILRDRRKRTPTARSRTHWRSRDGNPLSTTIYGIGQCRIRVTRNATC